MKKLILSICASVSLLATPQLASAFTYSAGDLILVFRDPSGSHPDVEFNIGTLSSLTSLSPGSQHVISAWDASTVAANYAGSLANAVFVVFAATPVQNAANEIDYLTDSTGPQPHYVTGSVLAQQCNLLNALGQAPTGVDNSGTEVFIDPPSDQSSYSHIVNPSGAGDSAFLGGDSSFDVESPIPGSIRFYSVARDNTQSQPANPLGSFTLDTNNVLTYTAGPLPPTVTAAITDNGDGTAAITFGPLTVGFNYEVVSATDLQTPFSSWNVVTTLDAGDTIAGNGASSLTVDVAPTDAITFYAIRAQ